jgi:arginine utilization protein RocB
MPPTMITLDLSWVERRTASTFKHFMRFTKRLATTTHNYIRKRMSMSVFHAGISSLIVHNMPTLRFWTNLDDCYATIYYYYTTNQRQRRRLINLLRATLHIAKTHFPIIILYIGICLFYKSNKLRLKSHSDKLLVHLHRKIQDNLLIYR